MGNKSELKKAYIVETARTLFADQGFKNVTMKDIAEACHISRGGLYLYYADTAALFLDVLAAESLRMRTSLEEAMKDSSSASERLSLFLKFQKKEIFASRDNLTVATYEYAFSHERDTAMREILLGRAQTLQGIIEDGVAEGTMVCENPYTTSIGMVLHLEGLRASARTAMLTTAEADMVLNAMRDRVLPRPAASEVIH